MRKTLIAAVFVLIAALIAVGLASANPGKIVIKGEVKAVGGGTLTVESHKGETYVISVPGGFDVSAVQVGDYVLVKASAGENGTWMAETIKEFSNWGADGDDDDDEMGKPEGYKDNSAFCADGKQEKPHPLAPKIAERFGTTEEWVMGRFCEGYSIGAIMLAIKTSQMDGMTSSPHDLLVERAAGNGWGLIWKGLGLIGCKKEGQSPPGLLKKPAFAGPK
jgi:hypothetical protein